MNGVPPDTPMDAAQPLVRDPIVAIATASGRGAIGIVRLSGPSMERLAAALFDRPLAPRMATLGRFLAADGRVIDQGLALHFPAPNSYTGESVLELQAHGGPIVLQLLLGRCLEAAAEPDGSEGQPRLAGLRLARPGEFTERAFLCGKLDLAQAEAVADLIDAGTEAAARSAAVSLQGRFSDEIRRLGRSVEALRLLVEATLDFPEEDIDFVRAADCAGRLLSLSDQVDHVLAQARQGALLREGLTVALVGQPNVGKSSLLNALAGAELAIVTPIPGTTRDRLRETIQVQGVPIHLSDTAGLRATEDEVERLGVARSWQAAAEADVLLVVHDLSRSSDPAYRAAEAAIESELAALATAARRIDVDNKCDLAAIADAMPGSATAAEPDAARALATNRRVALSARTGEGLEALRDALVQAAGWQAQPEGVFMARQRHLEALRDAAQQLASARAQLAMPEPALDLLAEDLRLAHRALGRITGEFTTDDLLGAIFSRFCIGK
jgi:tRNA modification GTPase